MKQLIVIQYVILHALAVAQGQNPPIFEDQFTGSATDGTKWHIPTWVSPTDGTYIGRTQLRCTQNASLPAITDGNADILLETYNPTGFSMYGTDLITNVAFSVDCGLVFTVRAKMAASSQDGYVGGIFLYDITSGNNHDEIDFEMLSNQPGKIQTNYYADEPLGAGHPEFAQLTGTIYDYHTYVIRWLPDTLEWLVDGVSIRKITSSTGNIPAHPMHFHLNIWAPAAEWAEAYSATLQPVASLAQNQAFSMKIDYVIAESLLCSLVHDINRLEKHDLFFPNPASGMIFFNNDGQADVSISGLNGTDLMKRKVSGKEGLDVSSLPGGLYIVSCRTGTGNFYSKLLKY